MKRTSGARSVGSAGKCDAISHLGTAVLAVREAMGMMAFDNLVAHFEQKTPPNLV